MSSILRPEGGLLSIAQALAWVSFYISHRPVAVGAAENRAARRGGFCCPFRAETIIWVSQGNPGLCFHAPSGRTFPNVKSVNSQFQNPFGEDTAIFVQRFQRFTLQTPTLQHSINSITP